MSDLKVVKLPTSVRDTEQVLQDSIDAQLDDVIVIGITCN